MQHKFQMSLRGTTLKYVFCLFMVGIHSLTAHATVDPRDAVVKIFVTKNPMDFYRPWQSKGSQAATGSGFIISGNRIITNAHVVQDATFIQVRKESDPKKYTATLLSIGHDCDLAILTVNDATFFQNTPVLSFSELPQLQDSVMVLGFPTGGDKLSITKGVVSRIEVIPYSQSGKRLLSVQIDAAINPGNSGGPVLKDNKVIGVAMQIIANSQNIGYMIPTPIINHFIEDLEDQKYDGFPSLGVEYHNTENKTLRQHYDIVDQEGGVIITWTAPYSPADQFFKERDILFELDGVPIGVDGTFSYRDGERLSLSFLITQKQIGEKIEAEISRNGNIKTLTIPINNYDDLVPDPNFFTKPSYYIYGGLVFTVLSADLIQVWGHKWWKEAPDNFLNYILGVGRLNPERKKDIVVLLTVLPDDINVGYHSYSNQIIDSVNGKKFLSFKEFVQLTENSVDDLMIFETEMKTPIIIKNSNIEAITKNILERNNIPAHYSQDVAGWLSKKGE